MEHDFALASLLAPISDTQPAGDNIEYQQIYEQIRQARKNDPDYLPQDEWASAPRRADWKLVARLSEQVLAQQSKDFQIASWLAEAWLQRYSLRGLKAGLTLIDSLITTWWEQCWPLPDEEGLGYRLGILSRLDRDISQYLMLNPLMDDEESSLAHWHRVLSNEHQGQSAETDSNFSMATFNAWARKCDPQRVSSTLDLITACQGIASAIEKHYGEMHIQADGFVFNRSTEQLDDLYDFFVRIAEQCRQDTEEVMLMNVLDPQVTTASEHVANRATASPQIMSRDLAITQMLTIAHYFRQSEPSSPVPMLMERAARWANMALNEWLEEMVSDERSLQEINLVLKGPAK